MHGYAKEGMDDFFLFKEYLSFFKQFVIGGMCTTNRHLLVLDSHGSHVTLEVVKQAHEFGLDMITLLTHTSHALQSLDISCFKPFKTTFRRVRDVAMANKNYMELYTITLTKWVDQVLE
jgi:hypothetical protein